MRIVDVAIVGAGAAGMMCAIQAAKRKRRVLLIDHSLKIGRKILISGGGRCNFTNINASSRSFVSKNPQFCKSALSQFGPDNFIAMIEKHKIAYHEKKLGQLFCDQSAQNIVDMLVKECDKFGVAFSIGSTVHSIRKDDDGFILKTTQGLTACQSLVIATGGLSIPKIGATSFGYDVAKQFGLSVVPTQPALDGFKFQPQETKQFADLAGVSIDTIVQCNRSSFRENILFTHVGLSGPAALQSSLYWNKGDSVSIDLSPEYNILTWLLAKKEQGCKTDLKNLLSEFLPKRFAEKFCTIHSPFGQLTQISNERLKAICEKLHNWTVVPSDTVGYSKAEVTKGGVDTDELSSKTMESRKVPGLYFIGEVVDVTGQLGGYNFQWAWSSGYAAGEHV